MKFTLSNAQQKEVLIRGQPLLIALPMQRDCDTDDAAAQLAAEWLLLPDGVRIASARAEEIIVASERLDCPRETLSQALGAIVPEGRLGDYRHSATILQRHVVILAIVRGPAERHPLKAPQWPGGKLQ